MKRDVEETAKRRFKDPNSFVFKDGREVLYGLDWKRRVKQLQERCGGICEYIIIEKQPVIRFGELREDSSAIRCSREAADPHHIKLRSRGRDDRLSNLLAVCRHHHQILDAQQRKERHKR